MVNYFPVFLNLLERECVVVGAGKVAERKVIQLIDAGANVTIIASRATNRLRTLASIGKLTWHERSYQFGDLEKMFLAIAATDSSKINREVQEEASGRNILVNVADTPSLCNFISPAIVKRGPVTVAISTSGSSPALARHLRELMEGSRSLDCCESAPSTCRCLVWADAGEVLSSVRQELKAQNRKVNPQSWQEAMDCKLLSMVEHGKELEAKEHLLASLLKVSVRAK